MTLTAKALRGLISSLPDEAKVYVSSYGETPVQANGIRITFSKTLPYHGDEILWRKSTGEPEEEDSSSPFEDGDTVSALLVW